MKKDNPHIVYLTHSQIDTTKWDLCINTADNGLIYALSTYLNCMSKNWDALVLNDYEAVMPLPWNKKYAIHYLYQPFFTACLGIFGKNISAEMINDFLSAIPSKFKYWDFYLNHGNYFTLKDFTLYERMNYVLSLNNSYENIYSNYRDNIKRNIKKSEQVGCIIRKNIAVADVIAIAREQALQFSPVTTTDYDNFEKLYQYLHRQQKAITYAVYMPDEKLVASAVFFFSHNRAYYILVGNHPNSKTVGASHALINAFIKDYSGQNLLLDFEGSDIRNLAFFYSSFGASEEKYAGIKLNKLPYLLRLLKK